MTARKLTAAALALAGVLALVAGLTCAPPPAAVAPVPIARLGLPPEAVEPFREFVASLPKLNVLGAAAGCRRSATTILPYFWTSTATAE